MRTRVIIFDSTGAPLIGIDSGALNNHAARCVADNLALLAAAGITGCIVVEFDHVGGADDATAIMRTLHLHRAQIRARPDGTREVFDIHAHDEPDVADPRRRLRNARSVVRALRVLHAPDDIANPRTTLRGTP
jgi:hypothetical protein